MTRRDPNLDIQCIYCLEHKPQSSFRKTEHVIPQSFGRFKNNFTLHNMVCDKCNKDFGDNLEIALGRDTLEGWSRYDFKVKDPNDFKSLGKGSRITIRVAEGELEGAYAYREYSELKGKVVIKPLPQIGFLNPDGSGYECHLPDDIPDRGELESRGFDFSRPKCIRILGVDVEHAKPLLEKRGFGFKVEGEIDTSQSTQNDWLCEVEATIDRAIFRAVAKIAFNYLAYWEKSEFVLLDDFMPIRQFILNGLEPAHRLVRVDDEAVLGDERGTDKRRLGHIVALNWVPDKLSIVAHVSLMNWARYSVLLARDFKGGQRELTRGHFFNLCNREILDLGIRG